NGKDRGVRADAQRQSQNGNSREAGIFHQHPDSEFQVLRERSHFSPLAVTFGYLYAAKLAESSNARNRRPKFRGPVALSTEEDSTSTRTESRLLALSPAKKTQE